MSSCLLLEIILTPSILANITSQQWDLLIRQGRSANLLPLLAHRVVEADRFEEVPIAPRHHLSAALLVAAQQDIAMRWEVSCISTALSKENIPLILLKGAAYLLAELPLSSGRMFSDVDILVPKEVLGKAECALMIHGWRSEKLDVDYQNYYRRWMHEIPPMRHVERGTYIDVHHAILPETARIKVNSQLLFETITPVSGSSNVFVLQPVDMLLHSATHLFHEGELPKGLRDLLDLDALFRDFGEKSDFWEKLTPRAQALGLLRPLLYAVRYCSELLHTPFPSDFSTSLNAAVKPHQLTLKIMDFCYRRALMPMHQSCNTTGTSTARFLLYIRSHWIRMPAPLLIYHLTRKAFFSRRKKQQETAAL